MEQTYLFGKNLDELEKYCISNNYPKFHGNQLFHWMYNRTILTVEDMSNIPKKLKNDIVENCYFESLKIKKKFSSKIDNTIKYLFETEDNKLIESVSMIENDRHTICLSSQIGCSVDCSFCATGKMGIIRNLDSGEILEQIIKINQDRDIKITNLVFMGMGEPFLNYDNVIKACKIINNPNGFNISSKKITISTSGILPKIKKYIIENHKFKLAISLNASNNSTRNQLIPINKKWPIEKIISSIKNYKFSKYRPIMFEYILMKGVNDSNDNAIELSKLLKNLNCKVNIIPYNETDGIYNRSDKIDEFIKVLKDYNKNLGVFIRWSKGEDINAACGQLVTNNE
tara:strand:+ start:2549 stop:3574 length:1026 start_codon:yes stop_codon:yes gene_type:complete